MPDWWRDAMRNILIGLAAAISALGASAMALHAQTPARNVWDGVFTADQAAQGKALFEARCAMCHGSELTGVEMSPPLAGARFRGNWSGVAVAVLFPRPPLRKTGSAAGGVQSPR